MGLFISLLYYIKKIFVFKKYSYVVFSFLLTLISSPFLDRIFSFLKKHLSSDEMMLTMLITIFIFFIIFIVITFDTITGLMAAKHEGQEITAFKGLISTFRMIFYTVWIFIILIFQTIAYLSKEDWLLTSLKYVMIFSAILITLWEFKSIGVNLKRRFNKDFMFFHMIDKIIDILERKVENQLESLCKKTETDK